MDVVLCVAHHLFKVSNFINNMNWSSVVLYNYHLMPGKHQGILIPGNLQNQMGTVF